MMYWREGVDFGSFNYISGWLIMTFLDITATRCKGTCTEILPSKSGQSSRRVYQQRWSERWQRTICSFCMTERVILTL